MRASRESDKPKDMLELNSCGQVGTCWEPGDVCYWSAGGTC
jgi:hypothetical protein